MSGSNNRGFDDEFGFDSGAYEGDVGVDPVSSSGSDIGFNTAGSSVRDRKGSGRVKKVLGVVLPLVVLGGVGYVGYSNWHTSQVARVREENRAKANDSKFQELSSGLESSVRKFKTDKILDTASSKGISLWDLNLTYVSSQDVRVDFASAIAKHVTVKLDKGLSTASVKYPNWKFIDWVVKNVDSSKVTELTKDLNQSSYTYNDDLINAFSSYISSNLDDMLSFKGDYVASYMSGSDVPKPYLESSVDVSYSNGSIDSSLAGELDKLVFSSDDLHTLENTFSGVSRKSYGELQESKAHADWKARDAELVAYINNLSEHLGLTYRVGENDKANTTSEVKDESLRSAIKTREDLKRIEPTPYTFTNAEAKVEKVMTYGWIGSSYIKSKGSDSSSANVHMGDGSYDSPYTLGTPFVTKMLGTDGSYHDVRVTVRGVELGKDAQDSLLKYDDRNSGFSSASDLVLGLVRFEVENLSDSEVEVNSEFSLSDSDRNLISRTGTLYSVPDRAKIGARGKAEMADWFYSKETKTSCLLWGKTFNRQFDEVFINTLGDEIYDAYGRTINRKTKKIEKNKAQENIDALKRIAEEEVKEQKRRDEEE